MISENAAHRYSSLDYWGFVFYLYFTKLKELREVFTTHFLFPPKVADDILSRLHARHQYTRDKDLIPDVCENINHRVIVALQLLQFTHMVYLDYGLLSTLTFMFFGCS